PAGSGRARAHLHLWSRSRGAEDVDEGAPRRDGRARRRGSHDLRDRRLEGVTNDALVRRERGHVLSDEDVVSSASLVDPVRSDGVEVPATAMNGAGTAVEDRLVPGVDEEGAGRAAMVDVQDVVLEGAEESLAALIGPGPVARDRP